MMLISRKIGDLERDHFQGILDAFYAIALTFLTIDLPFQIQELFEKQLTLSRASGNVELLVVLLCLSHVFIFIILFEVLCFHKAIIKVNVGSLFLVQFTVLVMALTSLVPVLVHVVNHARQEIIFSGQTLPLLHQLNYLRSFLWGDLTAIYLALLVMNSFAGRNQDASEFSNRDKLSRRGIHRVLAIRLSFSIFYLYCVITNNAIARDHPLLGFSILVIIIFVEGHLNSLWRLVVKQFAGNNA